MGNISFTTLRVAQEKEQERNNGKNKSKNPRQTAKDENRQVEGGEH